jgi:hypothetical protein
MTKRQAIAYASPCARAVETTAPAFQELVGGFRTIFSLNK